MCKNTTHPIHREKSRFSIGNLPFPVSLETSGFLLIGGAGENRLQVFTDALDAQRADGALAVVADAWGIYTSRYYQDGSGDAILNPFDSRCVRWSPLAELESVAGIPALAKSLVPDTDGLASELNSHAQIFIGAILEHCFLNGLANRELSHFILSASSEELREICADTPAAPLFTEGLEGIFNSIRRIVSSSAQFVQHLDPASGARNGFSIRKHITDERAGWIFLGCQKEDRGFDSLRSMNACAIDIASRAVLSLPPSPDRRVFFALDALRMVGKIQSLMVLTAIAKDVGVMIFAAVRSISQLREVYGKKDAEALIMCFFSVLVFRVTDDETAEYVSRLIGYGRASSSQLCEVYGHKNTETPTPFASFVQTLKAMKRGSAKAKNRQTEIVRTMPPADLLELRYLRGIFFSGPRLTAVDLKIAPTIQRAAAGSFSST